MQNLEDILLLLEFMNFDNNLKLKSLLPDEVKLNITIDDTILRSNSTTNKTIRPTKGCFFMQI